MKCVNHWIIALGATAVSLAGQATQATVFPYGYEGNALPQSSTNPVWERYFGGAGTTEGVSGGILTTSSDATNLAQEYRTSDGANAEWNPIGAGTTVEARIKIDSLTAGGSWAGSMLISTGSRGWAIGFGPRFISDFLTGGDYDRGFEDFDFHTYRLVVADEVNGPLDLYIDGGVTPVKTWAGVPVGADRISFGDLNNNDGGQLEWDYIRWTNGVAEVPEPTALSFLALGGLTLLRARRK